MVDQAASRPQSGNAGHTAPFMRVDLREETVTEHATPGEPGASVTCAADQSDAACYVAFAGALAHSLTHTLTLTHLLKCVMNERLSTPWLIIYLFS